MKTTFDKIRKYNPWDGYDINLCYERKHYLEKILAFTGNKLVKVIVGQRRCGKSYILRQIIKALLEDQNVNPKNIFYLNKEYTSYEEIVNAGDLEALFNHYRETLKVAGKVYLFLDEIQNIDRWETFVNSYAQDFTDEVEIFITGSNSELLSGELATLLSGRYVQFEVMPFSLQEVASVKNGEINTAFFMDYLKTGGLPELLHLEDEEIKKHYVADLRNTIVLRDIMQRNTIKDLALLEDLFRFVSTNMGSLTSVTGIIDYFKNRKKKTNYETISTYLKYLTETFVVHEAERYNLRGKQTLSGNKKYYLNDTAFKNLIFGFYPTDVSHQLENYVYMQLKRMGYHVFVGVLHKKEIDFVAIKNEETLYVQVALQLTDEKTIAREFGNLLAIKDNHEKVVVSMDETKFSNFEGIRHLWPWELQE